MHERRHFTRVLFHRPALVTDHQEHYHCQLLDLSLKGALISHPENFHPAPGAELRLSFTLADTDIDIQMNTEVAHIEQQHIGLRCTLIDLDSATHLKRLIELNVGDDKLLHRELVQLASVEQQ
ncbi:PilZ domain-containing protein [Pseudoalteromonas sp. BDTF-M6]|uniref:PilZ domain-containing protein n=1 Tax=Pseudoalteromonas sp. BDTF-M6 TaxID=2796132 RepID=UPI001BAEE02C|nr:PilZ domain-containing protein [Pseudoalteromonas sp. BDTF-M6]MBS3798121.1 PilZ domain-containing protein [Pseudoalteromonas sp. BDTF-M6]